MNSINRNFDNALRIRVITKALKGATRIGPSQIRMDIAIVTTAKSPEEARALLEAFGMPFEKPEKS